ncbi:MAG: DUF4056 domain-containing protein [Phycisphaerales bacterium]|jgi:hypothetical protein
MKDSRGHFVTKAFITLLLCCFLFLQTGCSHIFAGQYDIKKPPRIRPASYASSTLGTTFIGPSELLTHGYTSGWSEGNGIVYTCRGGHIDIAHLRKTADWTAFLTIKTLKQIKKGKTDFTFKLKEPSVYHVHITYPEYWKGLSKQSRERYAREIALGLGQYFAYTASVWHEILTWFGWSSIKIYPEFPSAFSWEDSYSNLLGTHIAVKVLRDNKYLYDAAMTLAIKQELIDLKIQSKETAMRAAEAVKGQWFSDGFLFLVKMKGRNFDLGLDDGFITPWIVPGIAECHDAKPKPYPVPTLDFLDQHKFSVKLEIEPKERESKKILKVVYPDKKERKKRIEPAVHFAQIMDYIKEEAIKKYGPDVAPTSQ